MTKSKRHYHHQEDVLRRRLKLTLIALVTIPVAVILMFVFFGPLIGSLFGIFSVNRNFDASQDRVAPPPPIFNNAPRATNQDSITLYGYAENGSTIKLYVNGPETGSTVATADGEFQMDNVSLIGGRNTIYAKAIDASGNESDRSATLTLEVDKESPKIDLESPKNDDVIKNLNKRVFIRGSINEKATVKVNDKLAVLRPDLSFEFPLGVEEGDIEVIVTAEDEAGNKSEEKININYLQQTE